MSEYKNHYPWVELGARHRDRKMDRNHFVRANDQNVVGQTVSLDGIRHAAYFEYARYMATIGAAPEEILRRLLDIDRRNSIHDDAHLESLSRRAARCAGFRACPLPQLEPLCEQERCPLAGRSRSRGPSRVTAQEDGRPQLSTLQASQAGQDPGSSAKGGRHD